jgi:DNA polymerase-3 subunit delta'
MHILLKNIFSSQVATIPVVIDEESALEALTQFSHMHLISLDECITGSIPGISLYQKQEEKKHLSIEDIRIWIRDIMEIPYEKKHIYILRDFDEATPEAMNATLKILEEPPGYAIIFLIVKNPESLLETIISRSMNLHHM